jgi:hypothetical protein
MATGKIVSWVVVALVVLGGLYYYFVMRHPAPTLQPETGQNGATQPALASGSDTSDAGLQQDLAGMDTQMSAMNSDTADIDSSMGDSEVTQDSSF